MMLNDVPDHPAIREAYYQQYHMSTVEHKPYRLCPKCHGYPSRLKVNEDGVIVGCDICVTDVDVEEYGDGGW